MVFSFDLLLEALLFGVLLGCFYAAVSIGLSVSFGLLDVPHVAHPAVMVLGSYFTYVLAAYGLDPIGTFALTTDVYHEIGRRTASLGRSLVILQEGGYHRPSLGENARSWLRGAEGRPIDPLPAGGSGEHGTVAG